MTSNPNSNDASTLKVIAMVMEAIVDVVVRWILVLGLPVLIVLFFFEGLVIGKLLQPPAVFVTVIAITTPPVPIIIALSASCTLAVVAGQWTAYRSVDDSAPTLLGLRRQVPWLERLPNKAVARIGETRVRLVNRSFARFGGSAIFVATFLPGIRGLLAIPAGLSSYPTSRFLAITLVANALYFPLLVAVAFGILRLLGLR